MSAQETGGPAFPVCPPIDAPHDAGMTLRDYFAARAMQGLLAQSCGSALSSDLAAGAEYAYKMADAMLRARQA